MYEACGRISEIRGHSRHRRRIVAGTVPKIGRNRYRAYQHEGGKHHKLRSRFGTDRNGCRMTGRHDPRLGQRRTGIRTKAKSFDIYSSAEWKISGLLSPMLLPAAGMPILRFSSESFPEVNRRDMWREHLWRHIVALDTEPLRKEPPRKDEMTRAGGVGMDCQALVWWHLITRGRQRSDARGSCSPTATTICDWSFCGDRQQRPLRRSSGGELRSLPEARSCCRTRSRMRLRSHLLVDILR
jgi:hypothetical protein